MTPKPSLWFAAFLFCLLAAPSMWAQSQEQRSLGDVARQKAPVKAKRVVTNDEIPPSPEANKVPSPSSSPSKADEAPAASKANPPESKDAKSTAQPTKLEQLASEQESLQKAIKDLEDKIADTNDQQRKETLTGVLQHARQQVYDNQKEMDRLRTPAPAAANPPEGGEQPPAPEPPK